MRVLNSCTIPCWFPSSEKGTDGVRDEHPGSPVDGKSAPRDMADGRAIRAAHTATLDRTPRPCPDGIRLEVSACKLLPEALIDLATIQHTGNTRHSLLSDVNTILIHSQRTRRSGWCAALGNVHDLPGRAPARGALPQAARI